MHDYLVVFHLQKLCTLGANIFLNLSLPTITQILVAFFGILVAIEGNWWRVVARSCFFFLIEEVF